jgi:hypothetical protein
VRAACLWVARPRVLTPRLSRSGDARWYGHPQERLDHWWAQLSRQREEVGGERHPGHVPACDDCTRQCLLMQWGLAGLSRARDNIQNQLSELAKQKPRNKEDENLTSEMMRLESVLQVTRDDLVRTSLLLSKTRSFLSHALQSASNHKLQGIKDELKHIDRSLRQNAPEYDKVRCLQDPRLRCRVTCFLVTITGTKRAR